MNPVPPNPNDDGAIAQPSLTPSSELGSGLDSHWRAMFEMQQKNMMQLIEAIRTPAVAPQITLPEINPELPDADPRAWCDTIDICLDERPLEGASLIIALSKALKGNASSWLSQISHAGMTWQHFRDLFLARYASTETLAASLVNIHNGRPKEGECLAAYASRLMTTLLARWKNRSHEEIATSYVLAHVSQFDSRLNRLAFTSEIASRNKLLQEIKASASLKRKFDRSIGDGATDAKRFKPQTSTMFTCHKCGKPGHKAVNCRSKFTQPAGTNVQKTIPEATSSGSSKKMTCFRCGEPGHISTNCRRGSAGGATSSAGSAANASAERRVDSCEIAGVCGQLEQSGLTLWGISWFLFQDAVLPDGYMFNMCGVVIAGYMLGHTIERYTTINPVVGMTLAGALYRYFGPPNFLDNPTASLIDFHLRRIYPVIILTKGPLTWNWEYIKNNSVKVFSLATLPWIVECLSTAFFAHILLEYPWYWGLHLGSILASVSPAVVVPIVNNLHARGLGTKNQIALLVANAGGLDTAFTEGLCGVINSAIFYPAPLVYRIVKGLLAIFVGIALGIFWGVLSDSLPDHSDLYAPTVRSLLIFGGGVLLTYAGGYVGWGGTSGVAIMVCAGAAATRWARRDWPLANNPVWEVYKLLWRIFEPMLFTLSGYFLDVSQINAKELCLILGCISSALVLRMLTAFLVALANDLSVKESLFIAVTWIPKAIVEAVLVRVAMDSLWADATSKDRRIASQHSNIIVIAILITSTLGSALTAVLGPVLLSHDSRVAPEDFYRTQTLSAPVSSNLVRRNNTTTSLQYIDVQ